MNKEQLLEQVRSGKLAIENDPTFKDNTLEELRECLNIIWEEDDYVDKGEYQHYFSNQDIKYYSRMYKKQNTPTIKVREALQILKEPNMEDRIQQLKKRLEAIEDKFKEQKTALVEPECPYKEGELIWVRNDNESEWFLRYSTGQLFEGMAVCYPNQIKSGFTGSWKFHASTNGLKLPE